jgi:acetoacetyl-CoA synthetase
MHAGGVVHKRRVSRHGRWGDGPLESFYQKGTIVTETAEGTLLWEPSEELKENARISDYMKWLKAERDLSFEDYNELWEWSVTDLEGFWATVWEYCGIKASKPYGRVLGAREMPGAEWFVGAELNYAEHVLRHAAHRPREPAILHQSEVRSLGEMTWDELQEKTVALAAGLREMGVGRGDRVAAYLPNIPEAVVGLLACASIGAIWSSCSPDFGAGSVVDRFKQIEPEVLLAVDGYRYGGKDYDRIDVVARLQQEIPTLQKTIVLPYLSEDPDTSSLENVVMWDDLLAWHEGAEISFEQVPFDHPLWVLYSSGTTGLPKPIVHSQGGILIEHLKKVVLHIDLEPDDRFFWFTTTGWMMWNLLLAGLLTGSTVLLYDGNPGYPDMNVLWEFAEKTGMTCFGTSASYITACMKAGIEPGRDFDLTNLESIGSTGSPLPPEGYEWAYEHVKEDLWLFSTSGGTDLCTAFVGGVPLLPVRAGELQARSLGAKVEAFDEEGNPQIGEVGELVITEPLPSMPIYFWNDPEGERYRESYFDIYRGVWRHGDWIKVKDNGACVIYGRSDSTINRGGIRMGTSEIYSAVDKIEEVTDSLVVDIPREGGSSFMPLFVVLQEGVELDDDLKNEIKGSIKENTSPRHVPNEIFAVPEIPKTLNGKKLEVPVKKILSGTPPEEAASKESLSNPESLDHYVELAGKI